MLVALCRWIQVKTSDILTVLKKKIKINPEKTPMPKRRAKSVHYHTLEGETNGSQPWCDRVCVSEGCIGLLTGKDIAVGMDIWEYVYIW